MQGDTYAIYYVDNFLHFPAGTGFVRGRFREDYIEPADRVLDTPKLPTAAD